MRRVFSLSLYLAALVMGGVSVWAYQTWRARPTAAPQAEQVAEAPPVPMPMAVEAPKLLEPPQARQPLSIPEVRDSAAGSTPAPPDAKIQLVSSQAFDPPPPAPDPRSAVVEPPAAQPPQTPPPPPQPAAGTPEAGSAVPLPSPAGIQPPAPAFAPQATPAPAPPAGPPVWSFRVEIANGRTQLEASPSKGAKFVITCDQLGLQSPDGVAEARGNVQVQGPNVEGTCEKLTFTWRDAGVVLEGKVRLKCKQDGQQVDLNGDRLVVKLAGVAKAPVPEAEKEERPREDRKP